jgi:hypothetical protein
VWARTHTLTVAFYSISPSWVSKATWSQYVRYSTILWSLIRAESANGRSTVLPDAGRSPSAPGEARYGASEATLDDHRVAHLKHPLNDRPSVQDRTFQPLQVTPQRLKALDRPHTRVIDPYPRGEDGDRGVQIAVPEPLINSCTTSRCSPMVPRSATPPSSLRATPTVSPLATSEGHWSEPHAREPSKTDPTPM